MHLTWRALLPTGAAIDEQNKTKGRKAKIVNLIVLVKVNVPGNMLGPMENDSRVREHSSALQK